MHIYLSLSFTANYNVTSHITFFCTGYEIGPNEEFRNKLEITQEFLCLATSALNAC